MVGLQTQCVVTVLKPPLSKQNSDPSHMELGQPDNVCVCVWVISSRVQRVCVLATFLPEVIHCVCLCLWVYLCGKSA